MTERQILSTGKIPPHLLKNIVFARTGATRKEVLLLPAIGEDTTAVDLGEEILIATTDPITGAQEKMGWLAIKVALNDIGATGCEPICVLVTILVPENTSIKELAGILDDINEACLEENVAVAGGHTEVTPGISQPLICVTALGKTRGKKVLRSCGAKIGDDIVVTKWAGMEGTSILVRDFRRIFAKVLDVASLREAEDLLNMISVTRDGKIAADRGASACHDATEGGVLGAIFEICEASKCGAIVYADEIPVLPITEKVAKYAHIDPLKLVSSGCLVVTTPYGEKLCEVYEKAGINAKVVGKITSDKREIIRYGKTLPLEAPVSDELWQARRYLRQLED